MKDNEEILNEEIQAAALKYDAEKNRALQIIALGKGCVAESIIKAAQEHNVQVVKDKAVSSVLLKMKTGDEIPEQLYKAVAQILVFVSSLDSDLKARFGSKQ